MIAVDTNVLVHAHRQDSPWHQKASACVRELAEGVAAWAIPWPCLHEFLAVVTHPRIYDPPTPAAQAFDQVRAWMGSPSLALLAGEKETHWPILEELVVKNHIAGSQIHDAHVAALCRAHGVKELWTADRDFSRFPSLKTKNPLLS